MKFAFLSIVLASILCSSLIRCYKVFTASELAKYDGSQPDLPILLAIKGVVYDVSSGASFYGKDGSYSPLAGKAVGKAIAKWSTEDEFLNDDISDLTESELRQLDEIIEKIYKKKYKKIGYMDTYKGNMSDEL